MLGHKLGLFLALVTAMSWNGASQAGTVERRMSFGSISLVEEIRTRDPGEPATMHVATEWTKLHLRWIPGSGDLLLDLVDNGGTLQIEVRGHDCSSIASYRRYSLAIGEPELWQSLKGSLHHLVETCPRISPEQGAAYEREFSRTYDDYIAGVEALKVHARHSFKSLARCRAPKAKLLIDPFQKRCEGTW